MIDLSGYHLTFSEEFVQLSVSQDGAGKVWANIRESQRLNAFADIGFGQSAFVDASSGINPFKIDRGALTITARQAPKSIVGPGAWASGLLHTKASFSQQYGYFEMRASTPADRGAWPAFWLLPTRGGWPPELDVMEGTGTTDLYHALHTKQTGVYEGQLVHSVQPGMTTGFHTYGALWEPGKISFFYDGKLIATRDTPGDMHQPMYLLVDLAIHNAANIVTTDKTMTIDYVRAFSRDVAVPTVALKDASSPDGAAVVDLYGATSAPTKVEVLDRKKTYDADGRLVRQVVLRSDGSRVDHTYRIEGKPYVRQILSYDSAGTLRQIRRYAADGSLFYRKTFAAGGAVTTATYEPGGLMTRKTMVGVDKSILDLWFEGGKMIREDLVYAPGSPNKRRSRYYVGGVHVRTIVIDANGARTVITRNGAAPA